jgi:hypothetical protein
MRSILAGGHRSRLARGAPQGSSGRRVMAGLAVLLVVAAAVAPGASAGKPTIERIAIDETTPDDFLTEACGVPVTTRALGHVIVRTFSGNGAGPAQITTLNIGLTAMAGDNTYRFRDVGADHVQVKQDGTEILMIIGQVPFGFTGVLKIDLATEQVILEPQHSLEGRIEEACAALTA